ncbi:hypothetical protein ACGFIW_01480 [Micromonospora sp. NPDC048935]|uniref:hypothetical protein n=1 Tax=Micromonospora sp. NPDC048935 TaxID=3364262 RepID=UPI00371395C8
MHVVHSPEQLMAWKRVDVEALVGKHISLRTADDYQLYWCDPHGYRGAWTEMGGGVVTSATLDDRGEQVTVTYTDGSWTYWLAGQAVCVTVTGSERG